MKKYIALILVTVFLWSLTGCTTGSMVLSSEPQETYTNSAGVYITVDSLITENDKTVLNVIWHNESAYQAVYGVAYKLQKKVSDKWVDCMTADVDFIEIACILEPGSQRSQSYTISQFCDVSKPGTYRILVDCYLNTGENSTMSVNNIWAAFTLVEDNGTNKKPENVQYIRTNGGDESVSFPDVWVISSREELERYYEDKRETFDLERREKVYADSTIGFLDACDKYDDVFFRTMTW